MQLAWSSWLIGFGLTLAFELPLVMVLLRPVERSWQRRLLIAVSANLVTHPLVWFFYPLVPIAFPARLALSEIWAFGAEACFYALFADRSDWRRATGTSLLANATSFGLGWVVVRHFGRWLF